MLLERETPVNFVEVILDLRRDPHRMKLAEIAQSINVPSSTVKKWFYGAARPNFEDGRALVLLHERITKSCQGNQAATGTSVQGARARESTEESTS